MQEIKPINTNINVPREQVREDKREYKIKSNTRSTIIFIAVLVVVGGLFAFSKSEIFSNLFFKKEVLDTTSFHAVFLTNGQVYFGQFQKNDQSEIVLKNVYYLQLANGAGGVQSLSDLNQPKLNLIRLGTEIHGPTDTLYITKSQVLFYEKLREDSKMVESIKRSSS